MARRSVAAWVLGALLVGAGVGYLAPTRTPPAWAALSSSGRHDVLSCATTVTPIVSVNLGRRGIMFFNNGAATIFVGQGIPNALTIANGIPIGAGTSLSIQEHTGAMSCIVAAGTVEMRYLEVTN